MNKPMQSKTILITGATAGIGRETAIGLAKLGGRLTIVGRNETRGQSAAREIRQQSENQEVHFVAADLSTRAGVTTLAATIKERFHTLDVLINNAGGIYGERWETADGFEAVWAMNHLGPFLLTWELLPLLKAAKPARVVNLTTSGHRFARIEFDNLQGERRYVALGNYGNSKLANLMVMKRWAERLYPEGISVFMADPGGASTDMTDQMKPGYVPAWMRPLWPLMRLSFGRRDPAASRQKAARSSIFAASAPALDAVPWAYIAPSAKLGKAAGRVHDPVVQAKLWDLTLRQLELTNASQGVYDAESDPRWSAAAVTAASV